jgi:hypothetical protein
MRPYERVLVLLQLLGGQQQVSKLAVVPRAHGGDIGRGRGGGGHDDQRHLLGGALQRISNGNGNTVSFQVSRAVFRP